MISRQTPRYDSEVCLYYDMRENWRMMDLDGVEREYERCNVQGLTDYLAWFRELNG